VNLCFLQNGASLADPDGLLRGGGNQVRNIILDAAATLDRPAVKALMADALNAAKLAGAGTIYGDRAGLVKIVGESRYGELLGGHIVGSKATELIQELVNVRALEGGFSEVARMVHGHPTLSEAVMEAARAADGWLIHG